MSDSVLISQVFKGGIALADAWRLRGNWQDAHTLVQGLYPVAARLNDESMAQILLLDGRILLDAAMFGGQETLATCEETLERALVHAQRAGDHALLGAIWDAKGFVQHATYLGSDRSREPENELAYFEKGLALRKEGHDGRGIAESLFHVGLVYGVVRGDHAQALPYFEESYRLAQAADDLIGASYAIRHIGFAHHATGKGASAYACMAESLKLREAAGWLPGIAMALHTMAYAEADYGQKEQAIPHLARAKEIFESLGAPKYVTWMNLEIEAFGGK